MPPEFYANAGIKNGINQMNVDKKTAISINENTTVIIFSDGTNNLINNLIALSKKEPSLLFESSLSPLL